MSIPVYPSTLPGLLQSGYTLKSQPNVLRTQMADGYQRQRVVNRDKPGTLAVSLSLSGNEYTEFVTWINKNAKKGAGWFMAPILSQNSGDNPQYQTVRIQNGEISAALQWRSGNETRWKITLNLDVALAPIPAAEDDDTSLYQILGGIITSQVLDEYDQENSYIYQALTEKDENGLLLEASLAEKSDNVG